jgi:D-glycero-alpha-D-manno-heptose 1-phosphate guanylyltransferase
MQAVILAGGLGTRLRSVVSAVPKPLAPIGGRPFLAILLERLERQGIDEAVLAVGYKGGAIEAALGSRHGGVGLHYVHEDEPLGTGGALARALVRIERFPVLALNGDTLLELDLAAMLAAHRGAGARLTMAVRRTEDAGRYGRVIIDQGRVVGFAPGEAGRPGMINAGVYLFAENLFAGAGLPARFSFERDFLEPQASVLRPLAFEAAGYFIDIGVPEDYARAERDLAGSDARA